MLQVKIFMSTYIVALSKLLSILIYYFFMKDKKNMERSNFANNLIAIRKIKGLSQRDLAKITGISNRMIAHYEIYSEIPSFEKLKKIADALEVSVAELIDPNYSDKQIIKFNTRTIKKIELLEQLPAEDQKKVLDYIKTLIDNKKLEKQLQDSSK
jgi:transcriptional regulator with XRE-family HTH domain